MVASPGMADVERETIIGRRTTIRDVPDRGPTLDVRGTPYPPYIIGEEQRIRWDQCTLAAMALSVQGEPDGRIDWRFVLYTTRVLYGDPQFTSGTAEELATMEAEAVEMGMLARRGAAD